MTRRWLVSVSLAAACGGSAAQAQGTNPPGAALQVSLRPSEEVPTAVRMEVFNPHPAPIEFCRAHTPFEGLRNDIFVVLDADGAEVPYRGMMAKRAPPGPDDCFPVGGGRHHEAEVDLAPGYALQPGVTYTVRYRGSDISRLPDSEPVELPIE